MSFEAPPEDRRSTHSNSKRETPALSPMLALGLISGSRACRARQDLLATPEIRWSAEHRSQNHGAWSRVNCPRSRLVRRPWAALWRARGVRHLGSAGGSCLVLDTTAREQRPPQAAQLKPVIVPKASGGDSGPTHCLFDSDIPRPGVGTSTCRRGGVATTERASGGAQRGETPMEGKHKH